MGLKQAREFLEQLTEELCRPEFLGKAGLSRRNIQMIMNREHWEGKLKSLIPIKRRFTCREIFEFCEEPMFLLGRGPKDGWMSFTYRYVCHILYPDEEFTAENEEFSAGALFYLTVMRFFFDREREVMPYEPLMDFAFLKEDEIQEFETRREYRNFLSAFRDEFVYEMMRLNAEVTPFKTLEHIAGVHHVGMYVARGLYNAGVPIDLTLISGATAGHYLGKFGCKPNERVPYLHYYYTDVWFNRHQLDYIGHIAANHSTWDLEPENLSVESLVLIYADFRVKQSRDNQNREVTVVSSLEDAFNNILNKLDNVDEKKLLRYRFVYAKLRDFENYMMGLGVDVNLDGSTKKPEPLPDIALRSIPQTVDSLVDMAEEHNIYVMHRMGAERQFGNFLEAARTEKNWTNLRAYLNVFEGYFTYTNDIQKEQTLSFLYEILMHRDGDIRREAAHQIGHVLAKFNAGYRKQRPADIPDYAGAHVRELWKMYLGMIVNPDHKLTVPQKNRIRYNLRNLVAGIVQYTPEEEVGPYLEDLLLFYEHPEDYDAHGAFSLLHAVQEIPFRLLSDRQVEVLVDFVLWEAENTDDAQTMVCAWRMLSILTEACADRACCRKVLALACGPDFSNDPTMTFLQYKILSNLGADTERLQEILYGEDRVSDIFLDNLKTSTPWVIKAVNIKMLRDLLNHKDNSYRHMLHVAAHYSNLIKVSDQVVVRREAGKALLELADRLSPDQVNEVSVELVKGLEVGEYEYSKYIPPYLGEIALRLPPAQLEEIYLYLETLMSNASDRVVSVALDTVGVIIECGHTYAEHFPEEAGFWAKKKIQFLGLLLSGLASYRQAVRQEATMVIGSIFGSERLSRELKKEIFSLLCKKVLTLFSENAGSELDTFYCAATLTRIDSFITSYRLLEGEFSLEEWNKVAFFPGTFDPFTLSHKEIVSRIRDMGFEVYLAVDEFSWSKKTQPHLIRRQIASMSVANEFHVNLFPDDIPINLANPEDLLHLRRIFEGKELYVVVGSDVVAHASSYHKDPEPGSIHSMNHIAFRRVGDKEADSKYNRSILDRITGKVIELELPANLEVISSSMIRENIDMNRDISSMIDPAAQEYIYNSGLYLREPEYKPILRGEVMEFQTLENPDEEILRELRHTIFSGWTSERTHFLGTLKDSGDRIIILRNHMKESRPVGYIRYCYMGPDELLSVLKDVDLADQVRANTYGDILLIRGIYTLPDEMIPDAEQLLLSEAVAKSLNYHCGYAIFLPDLDMATPEVLSAVRRLGFRKAQGFKTEASLYMVDMHSPLILLQNTETTIKEPLASSERVMSIIQKSRKDLQMTMTGLYPGQLVLPLSASVIYPRLVDKITALNGVPREQQTPRVLGNSMCVPFGKILRGSVVPNTVTKTLHTDRVYSVDLKENTIEAFPHYTPLRSQVRMIKSFRRPVILVDDLLHRGGRLAVLEPVLREEQVEVKKLLLGVISGYGKDTMKTMGLDVDSVYFIPNLRQWFVESTMYPFIGGDSVRRSGEKVAGLTPAINKILPYTMPPLKDADPKAIFEFSACCIRNARNIFLALEGEYRSQFSRNLTLSRLSEAVIAPLCPDKGDCVNYDPNLPASVYLDNDLQMLYRQEV